jgi:ABC-type lipoprotein release transport system permease subunit
MAGLILVDRPPRRPLLGVLWREHLWPAARFVLVIAAVVVLGPFLVLVSLLPLSALLLVFPAFAPSESVLSESVARRSVFANLFHRAASLALGLLALAAIVACAVGVVALVPLSPLGKGLLVPLLAYLFDLGILLAVGRVPLAYNVRNLFVRWRITVITVTAFTVIVALLTTMLAFVNGMYELTGQSGRPGNVFVLSDGATDEGFSNLGYNDVSNVERNRATLDRDDQPLPRPIGVGTVQHDGQEVHLASRETYIIVTQSVPGADPEHPRRRFVALRGVADPFIAGQVHAVEPMPGGRWFSDSGVSRDGRYIEAVLGEGVAGTLGGDVGKPTLEVGDHFNMGDRDWVVTGILKSEGSTFGSEVWAKQSLVGPIFRKEAYTTLVLRTADDTAEAADLLAYDLRTRFAQTKLRAVPETEYYSDLSKTNRQFLVGILFVAAIMAIGGIFGVMNTMFAAISQRTKDIGMLRLLGFKRWQVLVSFMLESLAIATAGGLLGCALGYLSDGWTASSVISAGQGSGKLVVLRLIVDTPTVLAGLLFTMVMGRLGGLVPALSAMRLRVLESLR